MKLLWSTLLIFILLLQARLWIGEGSLGQVQLLQKQIAEQQAYNNQLKERNEQLNAEVLDLKSGNKALEEKARSQLGMITKGETFYLIIKE